MSKLLHEMINSHPWLSFSTVWLFFVICIYLEFKINKNKNVAIGGVLLLFGFLIFAVIQMDMFGDLKWILVLWVSIVGLIAIKKLPHN